MPVAGDTGACTKEELVPGMHTCIVPHALVYFAEASLNVVPELAAGPGQMRLDVCLWVVSLEVPQLYQAPFSAGLVSNHLEDVG